MHTDIETRIIAILAVDGENFEVDGCYRGKERKAMWYKVIKSSDSVIQADHLKAFPSHQEIRKLLN